MARDLLPTICSYLDSYLQLPTTLKKQKPDHGTGFCSAQAGTFHQLAGSTPTETTPVAAPDLPD